MLTRMTDDEWAIVLKVFEPRVHAGATRAATTANSLKRCIISLFTTSTGVRFLFNLAIGTASGTFLAIEPVGVFDAFSRRSPR